MRYCTGSVFPPSSSSDVSQTRGFVDYAWHSGRHSRVANLVRFQFRTGS